MSKEIIDGVEKAIEGLKDRFLVINPVEVGELVQNDQLKAMSGEIGDIFFAAVSGLLGGAKEDVRQYAQRMADDSIRVMQIADVAQRERLLNELMMQMKLIGEIHRIHATQEAWAFAGTVFSIIVKTAIKFLV